MSRAVYSARFIAVQGLTGSSSSVVVPTGHVYVVKQLTMYTNPTFAPARGFFVDETSGATLFSAATAAGTPGWFGFFGSLVFDEGQAFHWKASISGTDAIDVGAFGYDLTSS